MSIQIQVRDYRGCARADIELSPIALVAGNNEQGKSSLAQAVRAGLTGTAIPIPGVAKKDAKLLVRDGAETGRVWLKNMETAEAEGADTGIEWPKCVVIGDRIASDFAAGLRHLFDMDEKERANVLAGYINSKPDPADLHAAMADAGYTEKSIDQVWKAVTGPDGWDGTWKKAKDHGTTQKGKWEEVTGEKYGEVKARDWKSKDYPNLVNTLDPVGNLEGELQAAKDELERLIGLAAVAKADIAGLRAKAAKVDKLEQDEITTKKRKDDLSKVYDQWARTPCPTLPQVPMGCPKCGTSLAVVERELHEVDAGPTVKEITEAKQAIENHKQQLAKAKADFEAAYDVHQNVVRELREANAAKTELNSLQESGGEIATDEQVTAARAKVDACQKALNAYNATTKAAYIHTQVVKNAALVEILAPDGLRKRKLAAGLHAFNTFLEGLCKAASWPLVRLDESLSAHYGTRPVWSASASGQWRARLIVQVAMACMDGSAAVVIDEADILDQRGRNSLFAMLKAYDIKALVCMTINKAELVPNLSKAKMGASYWVQAGAVTAILEKAA